MYRDFYRLSDEPFRVTPDPDFLFLADQYKEALAAIVYGIAKRKGFVCITGEVGVGKTTILRSYLNSVDDQGLVFIYIFNPKVSFPVLMRTILRDLGQPTHGDVPELVERLHEHLIDCYRAKKTVVLFVDEAQNMPMETLENLRMLSNLETSADKLIQMVLVGQPELDDLLSRPQLRPLKSRIVVRAKLGPLGKSDSLAYIRHRLNRVALDDRAIFTDSAMHMVLKEAEGVPRIINILCDAALITGFGYRVRPIPAKVVREVIRDTFGHAKPSRRRLALAGAATAAALVAGVGLWNPGIPGHRPAGDAIAELILATEKMASAIKHGAAPPMTAAAPQPAPRPAPATNAYGPADEGPDPGSDLVRVVSPLPKRTTLPDSKVAEDKPAAPDAATAKPPSAGPEPEPPTAPVTESKPAAPPAGEAGKAAHPVAPPHEMPLPAGPGGSPPPIKPAHAAPAPDAGQKHRSVVVKPGDTLTKLSISVYGNANTDVLGRLQHANPTITDLDHVYVGQVIHFPTLPDNGQGADEAALRKDR